MNERHIFLVFSKTGTWLSKVIFALSNIKYAHVSISFDGSFTRMYSFGRINPDNPFSGGLVVENLYEGVYKKFPRCECLVYRVTVTGEQYLMIYRMVEEFLKKKDKYKYNFIGLIGVYFNFPIKRKNRYFCSQFVTELLIKSRVYCGTNIPELTRTSDLFSIENKVLMFEGYVSDFRRLLILESQENDSFVEPMGEAAPKGVQEESSPATLAI